MASVVEEVILDVVPSGTASSRFSQSAPLVGVQLVPGYVELFPAGTIISTRVVGSGYPAESTITSSKK
jgi:hypothetical protein